jgi:hypothetical protein
VLLKIAILAGVDIRWLITGESPTGQQVPMDHPVLIRAASLLRDKPESAGPLAAFVDLLAGAMEFPEKESTKPAADKPAVAGRPQAQITAPAGESPNQAWIPVLGRTAAGVAQFWKDADASAGLTMLADLIARHAGSAGPARHADCLPVDAETPADSADVSIVTLPSPSPGQPDEFVSTPKLKAKHYDAFALRVDGDSMSPEIRHGDLVVLSPSQPAADGKSAVVQLRNQIGVTCKLYNSRGGKVHLIPINEAFLPQAFPADQVVWALRVLARVRP